MTVNKKNTKQLILEAASDLFMNLGFQATSTRMIAEKAGITQPNLYHYFKNKEQIYLAVLECLTIEVKQRLDETIHDTQLSFEEKLLHIVIYLKEKHPANLYIMRHDIHNEISQNSYTKIYEIWRTTYLKPLMELFNHHHSALLAEVEPDVFARYFYATLAPYIHDERGSFKGLAPEQIITLFTHGILKEK